MPSGNYDWGELSKIGNRYTVLKQAEKDALADLNKAAGGNLMWQLLSKLSGNKEMRRRAVEKAPSMGFYTYITNNWTQPTLILPFFDIAGMNDEARCYQESFNTPATAALEKATAAKVEYKEKYRKEGLPVDSHDPSYQTMNQNTDPKAQRSDGKPVGSIKPIDPNHAWVVNIVKILDKQGLEKLSPEWKEMFDKAMNYWEPRGGFQ